MLFTINHIILPLVMGTGMLYIFIRLKKARAGANMALRPQGIIQYALTATGLCLIMYSLVRMYGYKLHEIFYQ